ACLASDLIVLRMFGKTISFTKRSFNFRICVEPIVAFGTKRRILSRKSDLVHLPNAIVDVCLSLHSLMFPI
ncbi:MAG: hypothetical protein ACTS45_00785, partial [Candidatus Hodgkinia cicadicola]